jgi:hypothetical protein
MDHGGGGRGGGAKQPRIDVDSEFLDALNASVTNTGGDSVSCPIDSVVDQVQDDKARLAEIKQYVGAVRHIQVSACDAATELPPDVRQDPHNK